MIRLVAIHEDSDFYQANPEARPAPIAAGELPAPPYQLKNCSFLMVGARFDPEAIRSVVPAGLTPAAGSTGGFYVYSAGVGWGIAPYTAVIAWIDVDGHDAPDNSKARFIAAAFYSGPIARILGRFGPDQAGESRQEHVGDLLVGTGGPVGEDHIRLAIRPGVEALPTSSGVHHYLRADANGRLTMLPVAFARELQPAEPISVEITAPPKSPLRLLEPRQLTWAARVESEVLTLGVPSPLARGAEAAAGESEAVFLTLLSRLGLAAIIADGEGRVRFANEAGRQAAGNGLTIRNGLLRAASRDAQRTLAAALARAADALPAGGPTAIEREPGQHPLLVHVFPMERDIGVRANKSGAVLAIIIDPDRRSPRPVSQLRLLGLTKAQAKVAALVGSGRSPRETAMELDLAEATVRTTLVQVYARLGLSRQSELALLVARVAALEG